MLFSHLLLLSLPVFFSSFFLTLLIFKIGVFKAAVGMTVGGLAGLLLFRGGNKGSGWRAASVATGLGVAVGSTYARAASYNMTPPPPPATMASRVTKVMQEEEDGKE